MRLPEDPGGSGSGTAVGGDTDAISAGAAALTKIAGDLTDVPADVTKAGGQARDAIGDPGATSDMSAFTTAWSTYASDLIGQTRALAKLAQVGADDLVAATGNPRTSTIPVGAPTNGTPVKRYKGEAPGWHPPMLPGYVPPTRTYVTSTPATNTKKGAS